MFFRGKAFWAWPPSWIVPRSWDTAEVLGEGDLFRWRLWKRKDTTGYKGMLFGVLKNLQKTSLWNPWYISIESISSQEASKVLTCLVSSYTVLKRTSRKKHAWRVHIIVIIAHTCLYDTCLWRFLNGLSLDLSRLSHNENSQASNSGHPPPLKRLTRRGPSSGPHAISAASGVPWWSGAIRWETAWAL